MKQFLNSLKGDKVIWTFVALLGLFSFMPVFSASSNLANSAHGTGNTLGYLVKHFMHSFIGFLIIFVVMIFVARYLSITREEPITFKVSLWELWLPVFITLGLILPANFSTAALMFSMVLMLVYVGMYPLRYIGMVIGMGAAAITLFILLSHAMPNNRLFTRVKTWESRIENFLQHKADTDDYQIVKAKTAIATGGLYGLGPGKSVQKNFLPQSSSDFIYAIIVEEYGLVGGLGVMAMYLLLLIRFIIAAQKANTKFGQLVVVGLGFPIIFQALTNMAVAVNMLPVTGQPLPLVSSGGSSIWMTCIALGIIIGVTKKEEEIAQKRRRNSRRTS